MEGMEKLSYIEKVWDVATGAVVAFVAVALTVLAVVWFLDRINGHIVRVHKEDSTAAAADKLWTNYILLKREYEEEKDRADRESRKREEAARRFELWDKKKNARIAALEEQLLAHGIEPVEWEK